MKHHHIFLIFQFEISRQISGFACLAAQALAQDKPVICINLIIGVKHDDHHVLVEVCYGVAAAAAAAAHLLAARGDAAAAYPPPPKCERLAPDRPVALHSTCPRCVQRQYVVKQCGIEGRVTLPIIVVLRPLEPPLPRTDIVEEEKEEEAERAGNKEEEGRKPRVHPPESGTRTCSTGRDDELVGDKSRGKGWPADKARSLFWSYLAHTALNAMQQLACSFDDLCDGKGAYRQSSNVIKRRSSSFDLSANQINRGKHSGGKTHIKPRAANKNAHSIHKHHQRAHRPLQKRHTHHTAPDNPQRSTLLRKAPQN